MTTSSHSVRGALSNLCHNCSLAAVASPYALSLDTAADVPIGAASDKLRAHPNSVHQL